MVVVVFRAKYRNDVDVARLEQAGERMYVLASEMPGFISYKDFGASDGEQLSLVEFRTHEELLAWREHPEHKAVQEYGREAAFESYRIQVCDVVRSYGFDLPLDEPANPAATPDA